MAGDMRGGPAHEIRRALTTPDRDSATRMCSVKGRNMKKLGILSAVASLAMGAIGRALSAPISHHLGRTRYLTGYAKGGWRHFDPRINRHTGKPHEHKREIARRERQAAARSV